MSARESLLSDGQVWIMYSDSHFEIIPAIEEVGNWEEPAIPLREVGNVTSEFVTKCVSNPRPFNCPTSVIFPCPFSVWLFITFWFFHFFKKRKNIKTYSRGADLLTQFRPKSESTQILTIFAQLQFFMTSIHFSKASIGLVTSLVYKPNCRIDIPIQSRDCGPPLAIVHCKPLEHSSLVTHCKWIMRIGRIFEKRSWENWK